MTVFPVSSTTDESKQNLIAGFIAELMRRRVLQIGGAYIAGAWLGAEILNFLFVQFQAPDWTYRLLAIVLVVGFPISMVLAWVVQIDEKGQWSIDPSRGDHRTLAVAISIGLLITAGLSWLILPHREPPRPYEPLPESLAVLPLSSGAQTQGVREAEDTLYRSLMEGLENAAEITLVRLGPTEPPEDLVAFGRSLGVAALGTVQLANSQDGDVVRVELFDMVGETEIWSESFSWDPTRILETAVAIANGLREAMGLPVVEQDRFAGTSDADAYHEFLRGEELASTWTYDSLGRAIGEFQQAIDIDPGFVRAHVALAQAIYDRLEMPESAGDDRGKLEARARRAVEIAQKLDPESPDALSLLGFGQENRQMRIVAYERALELDPGHAITYFRYALQMQADSNLDEAKRLIDRAIALQPMNPRFRFALADILEQQGLPEQAAAEREKGQAFRR
jgi:tetratricopeptide (TPR) repeat protein